MTTSNILHTTDVKVTGKQLPGMVLLNNCCKALASFHVLGKVASSSTFLNNLFRNINNSMLVQVLNLELLESINSSNNMVQK